MKIISKNTTASRKDGFTIVELLMAMVVMSIVLAAVAGMASAVSNANRETKDMGEKQAEIRYTTMRLTELIKNASFIVPLTTPRAGFCVWTDSDEDGLPDAIELTYVEIIIDLANVNVLFPVEGGIKIKSVGESIIKILVFADLDKTFTISEIESGSARTDCLLLATRTRTIIISECTDAKINIDINRRLTSLKFIVTEADVDSQYEIAATRRCSAEHLLNDSWELKAGTDDDQ